MRLSGFFILLMCLASAGCGGNFLNENDRLRERVLKLEESERQLTSRLQGLEKQLQVEQQRRRLDLPEGLTPPVCVSIAIDPYTSAYDTARDGRLDAIRLYLKTLDAQDRFVQTLGELKLSVTAVRPGAETLTLISRTIDPRELDSGYRSGITGSHYTVLIPLDPARVPEWAETLHLHLELTDLLTSHRHQADRTLRWRAVPRPAENTR